jgi:hypothetical protein
MHLLYFVAATETENLSCAIPSAKQRLECGIELWRPRGHGHSFHTANRSLTSESEHRQGHKPGVEKKTDD